MSAYPALADAQFLLAEASPDIGYVVDAPFPGAPLLISFAFVDWAAPNRFDFARRTRKLMNAGGHRLNRIFVRDTANMWYHHGVQGLGRNVEETVASLSGLIDGLEPSSVMTIGQSMGAYGALLFGALLGADRTLAFGPLSYFRGDWARRDGDARFLAVMDPVARFPPAPLHDDLPGLFGMFDTLPDIRIVYGTAPSKGDPGHLDHLHAQRFADLPGARIEHHRDAPHAIVHWLIERRAMDALLEAWLFQPAPGIARALFGLPLPAQSNRPGFDADLRLWMAEQLLDGFTADEILAALVGGGRHPAEAQRELYKIERSPAFAAARRAR